MKTIYKSILLINFFLLQLLMISSCNKKESGDIEIKDIKSSSVLNNSIKEYGPSNLFDGSSQPWCENKNGFGINESIHIEFKDTVLLNSINLLNGVGNSDYFKANNRVKSILLKTDSFSETIRLTDTTDVQSFDLKESIETNHIEIIIKDIYKGTSWDDTCISEISFNNKTIDPLYDKISLFCNGKSNNFHLNFHPNSIVFDAVNGNITGEGNIANQCGTKFESAAFIKPENSLYTIEYKLRDFGHDEPVDMPGGDCLNQVRTRFVNILKCDSDKVIIQEGFLDENNQHKLVPTKDTCTIRKSITNDYTGDCYFVIK